MSDEARFARLKTVVVNRKPLNDSLSPSKAGFASGCNTKRYLLDVLHSVSILPSRRHFRLPRCPALPSPTWSIVIIVVVPVIGPVVRGCGRRDDDRRLSPVRFLAVVLVEATTPSEKDVSATAEVDFRIPFDHICQCCVAKLVQLLPSEHVLVVETLSVPSPSTAGISFSSEPSSFSFCSACRSARCAAK